MVTGERTAGDIRTGPVGPADFDRFFRQEEAALLRYCWGLVLDRESARDVAQESMTRAWRDWDAVAGGNPAAWIRTVALNLVRSQWRRDRTASALPDLRVVEPPGAAPVDADVVDALRTLPERQREAVVLHHLGDLSVEDCATVMGIGVPAVKTHLQRGRAALAVLLSDDDGGTR